MSLSRMHPGSTSSQLPVLGQPISRRYQRLTSARVLAMGFPFLPRHRPLRASPGSCTRIRIRFHCICRSLLSCFSQIYNQASSLSSVAARTKKIHFSTFKLNKFDS
ncbi:hypothetical protein M5D96_008814, partial [Drosophila gunungcola]